MVIVHHVLKSAKDVSHMDIFRQVAAKVRDIESNIQNEAVSIAADNKSIIIKSQVQQINASIDGTGQEITPRYSDQTRRRKIRAGRTGRVDLRDKNDFLNNVDIEHFNNEITITSFDEKTAMLDKRYNPFGLIEENLDKVRKQVYPYLQNWVKMKIGLR